jgi:hypothetical protein
MAKDYVEQRAAKTVCGAGARDRQTAPRDQKPYSQVQIEKLYRKDRVAPNLNVGRGDGLVSNKLHDYEKAARGPQFKDIDGRFPDYLNDVPEKSWLRGGGKQGAGHLEFDHVGNPGAARGGAKIEASGKDTKRSPFSAAAKSWQD